MFSLRCRQTRGEDISAADTDGTMAINNPAQLHRAGIVVPPAGQRSGLEGKSGFILGVCVGVYGHLSSDQLHLAGLSGPSHKRRTFRPSVYFKASQVDQFTLDVCPSYLKTKQKKVTKSPRK